MARVVQFVSLFVPFVPGRYKTDLSGRHTGPMPCLSDGLTYKYRSRLLAVAVVVVLS